MQVPIAIITLGLVLLILPDLSTTSTGFKDPEATVQKSKLSRVDFAGAINLALVVCTFSLFLDTIGKGQSITSLQAWSSLLIAALGFLSFIWIEQHLSQEPLLPISLLTNKDLLLPSLAIAFQHAAQFGVCFGRSFLVKDISRTNLLLDKFQHSNILRNHAWCYSIRSRNIFVVSYVRFHYWKCDKQYLHFENRQV